MGIVGRRLIGSRPGVGARGSIGVFAGLVLALGPVAPKAGAVGAGACSISGTIRFTSSASNPDRGRWDIAPAVIDCAGMFTAFDEKMVGRGSFSGSGSFTTVPSGQGGCLHELGTGTVDYWIPTNLQKVHVREPNTFLLAGAGPFTTPTLRGAFQVPVRDGTCLTAPVPDALFLAQVTMVRTGRRGS